MGEPIECPFCHEKDFYLLELKDHFQSGACKIFNDTPVINDSFDINKELLGL
jgi:S-adenosylmethionine:tRNA-ribosyltransferase-isomerase (queuine synthetase)